MKKYKGTPKVYEYWHDLDTNMVHAIVEWTDEKIEENKSNLFLISREHHDYSEDI